ncbi:MAG: hypothetical protein ACP5H8_02655 [Candidatus Micrarchaeia archaeon]
MTYSTLAEAKRVNSLLDNYELPSGEDDCNVKVEELIEMRERLIRMGFDKKFMSNLLVAKKDMLTKNEISDVKKQVAAMKYANYVKKSTLRRIDDAIASYRLAHLYLRSGTLENAYRHLPYDGNVLKRISSFGATAARAYFEIDKLLSGELERLGISAKVAIPSENGIKYESIQLYKIRDLDDYISREYGKDAEIVRTKIITRYRSILGAKAYRRVLACAYVSSVFENNPIDMKSDDLLLQGYYSLLSKYGIVEPVRIDMLLDPDERLVDEMIKEGYLYFENNKLQINEELGKKLNEDINKKYWEIMKKIYINLSEEFLKLMILTTKGTRKALGIFSFDDDIELARPIIEKTTLLGIKNPYEMIMQKNSMEDIPSFSSKNVGLAVFLYFQGEEKLRKLFGVDPKSIMNEYEIVKAYFEGSSGRGEKFLEYLKK